MKITNVNAREIFDSRGYPTVECEIILENSHIFYATVPAGKSTGTHEAHELRDGGKRLAGMGVQKAVEAIEQEISPILLGKEPNVIAMDMQMITLDGTENKSRLGANSILAASTAILKAQAAVEGLYLYELVAGLCDVEQVSLPIPLINIINGAAHADNNLKIQEFMVIPKGEQSIRGALEATATLFYEMRDFLKQKGKSTLVGDEGGFACGFSEDYEALDTLMEVIKITEKKHGKDFLIALDVAANSFYNKKTKTYDLYEKKLSSDQMIEWYEKIAKQYPLFSIEDGLHEDDWKGWAKLTQKLGASVQIVGDDLFATNQERIAQGLNKGAANAVLIKPNQIGTITETLQAISLCHQHELNTIISHRSGETEETFIVDLAIGSIAGQIKVGGLCRGERIAKYNKMLRIEDRLSLSILE